MFLDRVQIHHLCMYSAAMLDEQMSSWSSIDRSVNVSEIDGMCLL